MKINPTQPYFCSGHTGHYEDVVGSGVSCLGLYLVGGCHLSVLLYRRDPPSCQHLAGLSGHQGGSSWKVHCLCKCSLLSLFIRKDLLSFLPAGHLQQLESLGVLESDDLHCLDLQHCSPRDQRWYS